MNMTDLAKAIEALEKTLAHDPGNPAGFQHLAGRRLSNGDFEGAIEAYSMCITFEPRNAAAHNNLGVALLKAGRFKDAIATLEAAPALLVSLASSALRAPLPKRGQQFVARAE
jgi:superkiller protein 3